VVEPADIFHFGAAQHLYGVMYGDTGDVVGQAVLICSSLGQEVVRTQFIVRRLAERLASQGIPTLRFDWSGQGESQGEAVSLDVWEQDLLAARAELLRRTGAAKITVLGIRFGALVLARARAWQTNDLAIDEVVLWEPVFDGAAYLQEMLGTHRDYLRYARNRRLWTRALKTPRGVDLLGALYPEPLIREIRQTVVLPAQNFPAAAIERIGMDYGWNEIARIEQILPDPGISLRLLNSIVEQS
jgi:alpha-beta hydrolase superfamily lysophospholipase